MRKSLLFLVIGLQFFSSTILKGQCVPNRYVESLFASVKTQSNWQFQSASSLVAPCNFENLTFDLPYTMDVYEPVGDTLQHRPCIVFAHGGGFLIGDKTIIPVPDFCLEMASRGFVVVSIDYRKCFNALSEDSAIRAVYRAIQDMKAAIRFVKSQATTLKIDPQLVFGAGNSAGGIMAIHAAFFEEAERIDLPATFNTPDLGCLECSGNSIAEIGAPKAVINLWGAIGDTSWIDVQEWVPVISFHGDADNAVFPDEGQPFSDPIFPMMYGSTRIHQRLNHLGVPNEYHILPGEGHEPWLTNAQYIDFFAETSALFLFEHFLKPDLPQISGPEAGCVGDTAVFQVGAVSGGQFCWTSMGGKIIETSLDQTQIVVVWETSGVNMVNVEVNNQWQGSAESPVFPVSVFPEPIPQAISMNEDTLWVDSGYSYQWFFEGSELAGQTEWYLVPTLEGAYQVETINENGCSSLSNSFNWTLQSKDPPPQVQFSVSCENGILRLQHNLKENGLNFKIYDLYGRLLEEGEMWESGGHWNPPNELKMGIFLMLDKENSPLCSKFFHLGC